MSRGRGDADLHSNYAAGMRNGDASNRVCAEYGVIRRIDHQGFAQMEKVGINLDEEVKPAERAGTSPSPAAAHLRAGSLPGSSLFLSQRAPKGRHPAKARPHADLPRGARVLWNDIRPPDLPIPGLERDKCAESPALWNVYYLHISLWGGERPGPVGARVVAAGDSRGNLADPLAYISTKAACWARQFGPLIEAWRAAGSALLSRTCGHGGQ